MEAERGTEKITLSSFWFPFPSNPDQAPLFQNLSSKLAPSISPAAVAASSDMASHPRVVIVGGGQAGAGVAQALAGIADVTLVDP